MIGIASEGTPARDERPSPHADMGPHVRHKAIDGWRAVAVGGVVLAHALNYRFADAAGGAAHYLRRFSGPLAELGVQLFFVISGFIITSLLLREQAQRGRISIAAFYARRICRIMPPLLAYYAAVMLLAGMGAIALPWTSLASSATFTCNTGIVDCDWWIAHTWSLAVEEQFYLGWPLLFALVAPVVRPRLLIVILAGCTAGALVQRPVFHSNFTSFACIAAGALYAASAEVRRHVLRTAHPLAWLAVVAVLTLGPITKMATIIPPFFPFLVTYTIFAGNFLKWVRIILESPPLQIVGLGSYSIYLWQQLFLARPSSYLEAPFSIALLPVVVMVSVYLVERPFIRIGRKLSRRVEQRSDPVTPLAAITPQL